MKNKESHTGTIIVRVQWLFLIRKSILITELILIKVTILIPAAILMEKHILIGEATLVREAILMGEGFLIQEGIPIKEDIPPMQGMLVEITLSISHLMAMLRNQTRTFVMKLRDGKAFPGRDAARVKFQQVTPSQKFLVNNPEPNPRHFSQNLLSNNNNPEPNPPNLDWPSYLPQCTVSLLQASMFTLLLLPQSPLPPAPNSILLLVPHQPLLLHRLHPLLPLTLAASHLSLSAGWVLETLEGG